MSRSQDIAETDWLMGRTPYPRSPAQMAVSLSAILMIGRLVPWVA